MSAGKCVYMELALGLLIPLAGTTLGAAMVFLMKKTALNRSVEKLLLGFASGVMIAASVWSLLIPSIEMAEASGGAGWVPAVIGFLAGILFLLLMDSLIPHLHLHAEKSEGVPSKFKKITMMVLAVTLHNLPEGMAVGVTLAAAVSSGSGITMASALALSIGIAIQNFPEGAIVSMPLLAEGRSKGKAFLYGFLSGVVEPAGAVLTLLLTGAVGRLLPYLLSFAAGAMIYVVVEELIPEAQEESNHSNLATIGTAVGFALMMVLDVTLG